MGFFPSRANIIVFVNPQFRGGRQRAAPRAEVALEWSTSERDVCVYPPIYILVIQMCIWRTTPLEPLGRVTEQTLLFLLFCLLLQTRASACALRCTQNWFGLVPLKKSSLTRLSHLPVPITSQKTVRKPFCKKCSTLQPAWQLRSSERIFFALSHRLNISIFRLK